jgi:hypothetical protein
MRVYSKKFIIYSYDDNLSIEWIVQQDRVSLEKFFNNYNVEIVEDEGDE